LRPRSSGSAWLQRLPQSQLFGNAAAADDLVWFATSKQMKMKLPQRAIDEAMAENAAKARAEFENVWREDVADFIPFDVVEAVTDWSCRERLPGLLAETYPRVVAMLAELFGRVDACDRECARIGSAAARYE
jgi:hypothetical protein